MPIEPSKPPRFLYKYLAINHRTVANLRKQRLYFNTPKRLNDPFECQPVLSTTCTEESFSKAIREQVAEAHPDYSDAQLKTAYKEVSGNGYPPSPADLELSKSQYQSRLEKVGILSVSERSDSIVMWSHYGQGHKGLCLELDTERLPSGTSCLRVSYSRERRTINLFSDRECANLLSTTTKTDDWQYEAEWRIVKASQPGQRKFPRALVVPEGVIRAVIFGALIARRSRARVLRCIKHLTPPPDVDEAYLDEREYRINRRPFND